MVCDSSTSKAKKYKTIVDKSFQSREDVQHTYWHGENQVEMESI
jgi:hypothetical protein